MFLAKHFGWLEVNDFIMEAYSKLSVPLRKDIFLSYTGFAFLLTLP